MIHYNNGNVVARLLLTDIWITTVYLLNVLNVHNSRTIINNLQKSKLPSFKELTSGNVINNERYPCLQLIESYLYWPFNNYLY